jgi:hypothetical protein
MAGVAYAVVTAAVLQSGHAGAVRATEVDGVAMPEVLQAAGTPLRLNGVGLRTYSLFHVHVYLAALYLEQPSSDAEAILHSAGLKLLDIHFLHDVTAARAREAWRNGLHLNCVLPCRLAETEVAQFLAEVPDFHKGDVSTLLFTPQTVEISVNGRMLGTVRDPDFSRTMLANFIGAHPPTETFKHALLGVAE